ncbi:MAG: hypothetical protein JSR61_17070 [Proteobacteria bacterium]|nr:hypothetical protein [Pseudomonadota bacterium]
MLRVGACVIGLLAALPSMVSAEELTAEQARHFVVGKTFNYTCFEGTRGRGRVHADGSVVGSIQFQGAGKVRYAALPANTLHVKDGSVCATLKGLPIEPCFRVTKVDDYTFRGSISGLGFAYCEFSRRPTRSASVSEENGPLKLRSSFTAENN